MRILIADAQPKVRFALRVLLERQPDLEVVGEAVDAESLLSLLETVCPDIVLLGWELPGMDMECLMPSLREGCPKATVIALSGRLEASRAASAIGADAFVSKSSPPDQLLDAIAACTCRQRDQEKPSDATVVAPNDATQASTL
ncbi:MAG: response regulator transcription factor [Anaerolineae bacterium]